DGGGCGPLDPTRLHIEDPSEGNDDREAPGQCSYDIGHHGLWPVKPVHNRLDNLEHCERRDAVADKSTEYTPALQLREPAGQARPFLLHHRTRPFGRSRWLNGR